MPNDERPKPNGTPTGRPGSDVPRCPMCGEDASRGLIEKVGRVWVCAVCAFEWED